MKKYALQKWIRRNNLKMVEAANIFEVSVSTLSLVIHKRATPSEALAHIIEKVTKGEITYEQIMDESALGGDAKKRVYRNKRPKKKSISLSFS